MKSLVVIVVVAAASPAFAEERLPENALSLQVPSVFAAGLAGEYERVMWTKFSFVAALGLRAGASDDYQSRTLALGAEARVWIREDWQKAGPYVGARLDLQRTALRDTVDDRMVGASWGMAESLRAGWRFSIRKRVEITPSAGIGIRQDFEEDGRLASQNRGVIDFGLTVGALF